VLLVAAAEEPEVPVGLAAALGAYGDADRCGSIGF
jgi:hypothetical protein